MVVFVFVGVHEPVDVFAVPGVAVWSGWCGGFGCPGLPLVAEPCVEPWDVSRADLAVVDGSPVSADGGLESGELGGVLGDFRVQASGFEVGFAAFRADGAGIGFGEPLVAGVRRFGSGLLRFAGGRGREGYIGIGIGFMPRFCLAVC